MKKAILRGDWPAGGALPSVRDLAHRHGVSINTVLGAFRTLRAENLIETRPRQGNFVSSTSTAVPGIRQKKYVGFFGVPQDLPTIHGGDWYAHIIAAAERILFDGLLAPTRLPYIATHDDFVASLARLRDLADDLAGMIVFARPDVSRPLVDELDAMKIPWVSINLPDRRNLHNFVAFDHFGAGEVVGRCLVAMGIEEVLNLTVDFNASTSNAERIAGLMHAYLAAGRPTQRIFTSVCASQIESAGYDAMITHLKRHGTPRAVFAGGDLLARGALRACAERGLNVPGDVRIVATSSPAIASPTVPPLAAVETSLSELGSGAADMLVGMIRDGTPRVPGRRLAGTFTIRHSLDVPGKIVAQLIAENPPGGFAIRVE